MFLWQKKTATMANFEPTLGNESQSGRLLRKIEEAPLFPIGNFFILRNKTMISPCYIHSIYFLFFILSTVCVQIDGTFL
jgi:hypothetical protein